MSTAATPAPALSASPAARPAGRWYATVWRWHFYAGLAVAPFLLILAVTGAIYLFNTELNDAIYPDLMFVDNAGTQAVAASRWVASAEAAYPGGRVTRVNMPSAPGRSAMLFVTPAEGAPRRVFVDPASATVLGSFVYERTLVGLADTIHGSLMLGWVGDAIVEIAACWAVILIVTGLYLWWPRRNGRGGVWYPRLRLRGRRLWRDMHAVTGLYVAAFVLFLVFTGLPWAGVWGGQLLDPAIRTLGLGYSGARTPPVSAPAAQPEADPPATAAEQGRGSPWALESVAPPASGGHAHHGMSAGAADTVLPAPDIGVDRARRVVAEQGLAADYWLMLPAGARGVYTAQTYPDRPQGQRTLYIDRYSGAVLRDVGFAQYGPVGQVVELGVALHMGNYFGLINQLVMLATCLAIVMLVITGIVMWWRRRPAGGLGAPPRKAPLRTRYLGAIVIAMIGLFPLAGASLVLVLIADRALLRWQAS
ncbi:PepSY domain-containing protein [Salinisphaera sp. T31B1]|uniref:PepSY-associated TM helix domain-containing protein n=1 Tax=Salinisphaera sp. T31B1 TaxID=727963 RepID=UPI003341F5DD